MRARPALAIIASLLTVLAGCMVDGGTIDADRDGVPDGEGAASARDAHGEPERTDSDVEVRMQGARYRAEKTVTIINGVGVDTKTASIVQETVNGGMDARSATNGSYTVEVRLWADGETEEQARSSLERIDVQHTDSLSGMDLALATRVILRDTAGLPIPVPDVVGTNRGGSISTSMPPVVAVTIDQSGTNGGTSVSDLRGPWVTSSITNGGIDIDGDFDDLDLSCTNGGIEIDAGRFSDGDGTWTASCTNGGITVDVEVGEDQGFDVTADMTNGGIEIDLPDVEDVGTQSEDHRHVRTKGFADRAFRTAIDLDGTNGGIEVDG